MVRWIVCVLVGFLVMASTSAMAQEKNLAKEVERIGFTPVYPLRQGFTPGQVFRYIRDAQGRRQTEVLCENIFADREDVVTSHDWILSTRSFSDKFSLGAVIKLLAGALTNYADASADVTAAFDWNQALDVKFKGVKHNSVPVEKRFGADGGRFSLAAPCRNALTAHKAKDPRLTNLYIIAETLSATEISIEVDKKAVAKLGIDAKLNSVVSVAPNVSLEFKRDGDLVTGPLQNPIAFAYFHVRVNSYEMPGGLIGGGNAVLGIDLPED